MPIPNIPRPNVVVPITGLAAIASRQCAAPSEGPKTVPVQLNWQTLLPTGNPQPSFGATIDLSNKGVIASGIISQIQTLYVDNSGSAADVGFVFIDSGFEIIVPARTTGFFPVVTNGLVFFAVHFGTVWDASNATPADITNIEILNYFVPPSFNPDILSVFPIVDAMTTHSNTSCLQVSPFIGVAIQVLPPDSRGITLFAAELACNNTVAAGRMLCYSITIPSGMNDPLASPLLIAFQNEVQLPYPRRIPANRGVYVVQSADNSCRAFTDAKWG